jgi:hypothetical protein
LLKILKRISEKPVCKKKITCVLNEALMKVITDRFEPNNIFLNFLHDAKNETTQNVLISTTQLAVIYPFKITQNVFSVD